MEKIFVITIARGYGSCGKAIGDLLGAKLGIPCYEDEILQMASVESGISENLYNMANEKNVRGIIKRAIYNFALGMDDDMKGISGKKLFDSQSDAIRKLAKTKSCIIVGKCADYVLRDFRNVVRVYVEAPRQACIDQLTRKYGWSQMEAEERIVKMDHQRAEYYRTYAKGDWTNPTNYDITLNSHSLGKEGCVRMIEECLKYKVLEK